MKNDNLPKTFTSPSVHPRLDPLKFVHEAKLKTADGIKYVFCKDHGHKYDNGKNKGMYMPNQNDRDKWLATRLANSTAFKEKNKEDKPADKRKATEATPTPGSPP